MDGKQMLHRELNFLNSETIHTTSYTEDNTPVEIL
jgi:hypothetical protein